MDKYSQNLLSYPIGSAIHPFINWGQEHKDCRKTRPNVFMYHEVSSYNSQHEHHTWRDRDGTKKIARIHAKVPLHLNETLTRQNSSPSILKYSKFTNIPLHSRTHGTLTDSYLLRHNVFPRVANRSLTVVVIDRLCVHEYYQHCLKYSGLLDVIQRSNTTIKHESLQNCASFRGLLTFPSRLLLR